MKLPEADRQRIIGEVNQRMLGIAMGIRMGAAEAQRRVTDAQKAASEKAREAAVQGQSPHARCAACPEARCRAARRRLPPMERKAKLSGSRLDITLERNGQVVRQLNAEVDLPSLLGTVFSTTRRDRGEVPFAVARDGRIYTPTKEDQQVVETLGDVVLADTPAGTFVQPDWVIVTTADPTGSGLKFGIARPVGDSLQRAAPRERAQRRNRSRVHRSGAHRHRSAVGPAHAQPVRAQRRRESHRAAATTARGSKCDRTTKSAGSRRRSTRWPRTSSATSVPRSARSASGASSSSAGRFSTRCCRERRCVSG